MSRWLWIVWLWGCSLSVDGQPHGLSMPFLPCRTLTLLFVGDLMQHQGQLDAARTPGGGYDYAACFLRVKDEISKADLAVGNLEVTLGGKPYRGYPQFSAPDAYLSAIREAGFDVLLTANNHCLDRRSKGLERTLSCLDSLGIPHAGTYATPEERRAKYPLLVNANGFRVVFLNYTYGTNGIAVQRPNVVNYIDKEQIKRDIARAKELSPDLILACMHWGVEYRSLPEPSERALADWLLQQGVDHVIGSHPHVVQPIEVVTDSLGRRHVVAYSLGNYLSAMSQRGTDGGLMLKLQFEKDRDGVRLRQSGYSQVWVSRPFLSGRRVYQAYPSTMSMDSITPAERSRLRLFLQDSRLLFKNHNRGIEEYFFK